MKSFISVILLMIFYSPVTAQDVSRTIGVPQFHCDTLGYLFQGVPTSMYAINLATGDDTLLQQNLIPSPPNQQLNAFGYNRTDNFIWGYRLHTTDLVRIAANFSITIFSIPGLPEASFNVGDISEDGILYLTTTHNTTVFRVDLNPNSATYLQMLSPLTIDSTNFFDWSFSPIDGNIYAIDSADNSIFRFDSNTGTRTWIGIATGDGIDTVGRFGASYMDTDGNFYLSANRGGKIFKISAPHTGNTNAVLFSQSPASLNNDGALCSGALFNSVAPVTGSNHFSIYSEAGSNIIHYDFTDAKQRTLFVYDVLGKKIFEWKINNRSGEINFSLIPNAVYFYVMKSNNQIECKGKFIP